jgi:methylated-DNA-[protein]-cysteine S-methyltransferase
MTIMETLSTASFTRTDSPLGPLLLTGRPTPAGRFALTGIFFEAEHHAEGAIEPSSVEDREPFEPALRQLGEYFAGRRTSFDLELAPSGTPFQERVWLALREIPYGTTTTYGAIARAIGQPTSSRAVGAANGKNPLSIVVPCHRVIGQDGTLTGYAGGMEMKRALLELEGSQRSLAQVV